MKALEGKVALITGAGGGIGTAAALAFARGGARLHLLDAEEEGADRAAAAVREVGGEASTAVADVSDHAAVADAVGAVVEAHGRLDCAFNNAGISGPLREFLDYPDEDMQRVLSVNLVGVWNCMQEELRAMVGAGAGAIVNSSSGLGVVASPSMSAYVASKHAVMGLTQAAALEYASKGVRVNAVLPGVIDTAMPARLTEDSPDTRRLMLAAHPMGRLGKAEEVAAAAVWLCSDAASFVTGHGMAIDGGYLSQ
ncbi:MAG: glucose 1-dehydrogenase [Actinobacteria bacterium]|nr:glucose 1-dehydrogenase [Actinomycetota bacterium]